MKKITSTALGIGLGAGVLTLGLGTANAGGFFLDEHDAAAVGRGNAVTATNDGASSIAYNPAGIALGEGTDVLIGGSLIYLIDRYEDGASIYDIDFTFLPGVDRHPVGVGFKIIDHLTHNVYGGRMEHWANFYERVFNFREIRYFDIKGEYTGLTSKAMTAPDGLIRIPMNEEGAGGKGQIQEFLRDFNGEGIQHIAFLCDDLLATWDKLKALGAPFMSPPPASYYEMLDERLPGHGEPVAELQTRGILLDGSTENDDPRLLLQIFSETMIGPVFFEFIQRKRDEGFGEGNFTALFKSMERDQLRRGVLQAEPA